MCQKSYSRRLQRVLCDFAWEESFQGANERLEEHYGFQVCKERIRICALEHAEQIEIEHANRQPVRTLRGEGASWIVAEADGTMIRVVETGDGKDRRNKRKLEWKEARLAAACEQGSTQAVYEASFGSVEDLGKRWGHAALQAGWSVKSQIHVVSDGAPSPPMQV
jgi:hypothetical protein